MTAPVSRIGRHGLLLVAASLSACTGGGDGDAGARNDTEVPRFTAVEQLRIGQMDGDPAFTFGRLGGITRDDRGRIYAVDRQSHDVRVFAPDGRFLFRFGREGGGPGELRDPCCPAFSPDGELWIRDGGNRRYDGFVVEDSSARAIGTIRMGHGDINRAVPTTFDADGSLIDVGSRPDPASGQQVTVRFSLADDNSVVREAIIPNPPAESLAVRPVESGNAERRIVRYFYQPFGPYHLVAHGPRGEWAHAVSSRYAIAWRDGAGQVVRTITRDVQGPPLSAEERTRADSLITADRLRAGTALPFGVPDRKPPLRNLTFDALGRLWVERSVAQGAPREADIWSPDGEHVTTITWPAGIDLWMGWIGEREALGVARDVMGVERFVRMGW